MSSYRLLGILFLVTLASPPRPAFGALISWKCQPPGAQGTLCVARMTSYPSEVAFLIPRTYRKTEKMDWILYLHGINPQNQSLSNYLSRFRIAEALDGSGRNSVLVFPQSRPTQESPIADYKSTLLPPTSFSAFMAEVLHIAFNQGWIRRPELGRMTLAGHSGSYQVMAPLSHHPELKGTLKELMLLDANYGHFREFAEFAAEGKDRRLWSAYTQHERRGVACIQQQLKLRGVPFSGCVPALTPDCTDNDDPDKTYPAGPVVPTCRPGPPPPSPSAWAASRTAFWASTADHSETVNVYLPLFLKASAYRPAAAEAHEPVEAEAVIKSLPEVCQKVGSIASTTVPCPR